MALVVGSHDDLEVLPEKAEQEMSGLLVFETSSREVERPKTEIELGHSRFWTPRLTSIAKAATLLAALLLFVVAVAVTRPSMKHAVPLGFSSEGGLQGKQIVIHSPPSLQVKVLTYNLFWWNLFGVRHGNGGSAFRLIQQSGQAKPYDFMGFQECLDGRYILDRSGLGADYEIFRDKNSCMAYSKSSWALVARGVATVADDAQYGIRIAQWMRLRHMATGRTAFFMNHHGPLPMNSGGIHGGVTTGNNILKLMEVNCRPGDAVFLVGDFNARAWSATVRTIRSRLKMLFSGSAFGGIDFIFSSLADITIISRTNLGSGGSDHEALSVVVEMGHGVSAPQAPVLNIPALLRPAVHPAVQPAPQPALPPAAPPAVQPAAPGAVAYPHRLWFK